MKIKEISYLAILCLLLSSNINAQVTIGSGQAPNKGALLDLKTESDGSSALGLGLPRVELSNLKPITSAELSKSIGNTTGSYDMDEHVGLVVYNVIEGTYSNITCKTEGGPVGLYVWDGDKWQGIGTEGEKKADPGEGIVGGKLIDRDGNDYHIATFGIAGTWMTENLRTKTAPKLVVLTESGEDSPDDMYYAYPQAAGPYVHGQPNVWRAEQGLLYNWAAVVNGYFCPLDQGHGEPDEQTETIQGVCPFGWHVPSDREWNELEEVIAGSTTQYTNNPATSFAWSYNQTTGWRPNDANLFGHGKSMKSTTKINGTTTNGDSKPANNNGFNLLQVGIVFGGASFYYGTTSQLWTSSSSSALSTWSRGSWDVKAGIERTDLMRTFMMSVRCKKD